MYTRCPKCETCFRVTDRHLAIAKGKVRCGKCQLVFNAIEHAIDDLPGDSPATLASTKPGAPVTPGSTNTTTRTTEVKPASRATEVKDVAKTSSEKPAQTKVAPKTAEVKKSPVPPPKVPAPTPNRQRPARYAHDQ